MNSFLSLIAGSDDRGRILLRYRLLWSVLPVLFFSLETLWAEETRLWKNQSGKFSVKATALEFDGEVVVLLKEDDRIVKIPVSKLSLEDRTYLKKKGTFKIEDDPFGEHAVEEDVYDATSLVFPETADPIKTEGIVIASPAESEWSHEPDPLPDISLPKLEPLKLTLPEKSFETSRSWSDLYFNYDRPTRILTYVHQVDLPQQESHASRLFSIDLETKKIQSVDFPSEYRVLDLSPDGTRLMLRRTPLRIRHDDDDKSTLIHIVKLSRDLRPTHLACYEPFALEGWGLEEETKPWHEMTREERDAEREKSARELEKRIEQSRLENEARKKMTPQELSAHVKAEMEKKRAEMNAARNKFVSKEKQDRLGRTISLRHHFGTEKAANVRRGFWLDDRHVLLQSEANCLISMDTETGEVLWSVPLPGTASMPVTLSPGRRYCLIGTPMRLPVEQNAPVPEGRAATRLHSRTTPTDRSTSVEKKTTSWTISSDFLETETAPLYLFDTKNARFCGSLEKAADCNGAKLFDFSPDGKTLAALAGDGSVLRWELAGGKLLSPIYYSLPYHLENKIRAISVSIEKVYDNQEKPTVLRWTDDRYVKVGTVLIDTVAEVPVWRYLTFNQGFQRYFGKYYWFTNSFSDSMEIIPRRLPSSRVPERDRTTPVPHHYRVTPGTEVALRIDGSITKDRDVITAALTKKLTENGWILNPDASIFVIARIGREPERDLYVQRDIRSFSGISLTYERGDGKTKIATFTMPRYEILVKKGDEVLWAIAALPGIPKLTRDHINNKTAQEQIVKSLSLMNYSDWYSGVRIPKKIREEPLLKESSIQMLGAD